MRAKFGSILDASVTDENCELRFVARLVGSVTNPTNNQALPVPLVQCRVCNEPYQASRKESDDKALSFDDAVLVDPSLRGGAAHA